MVRRQSPSASALLATRPRGSAAAAARLPSIPATRTLALVLASLWSSNSNPFSLSFSLSVPFPSTQQPTPSSPSVATAFQPRPKGRLVRNRDARTALAAGRTRPSRQWDSGRCHETGRATAIGSARWYHGTDPFPSSSSSSSSSSPTLLRSTAENEATATTRMSTTAANANNNNNNNNDINTDRVRATRHLPRLFVEESAPVWQSDNNNDHDHEQQRPTGSGVPPLRETALVPLTADQEHYLLDVMRITNPKRWGKNSNDGDGDGEDSMDYTGCVRVFNGVDGEWLARVVVPPDGGSGGGGKKKPRRRTSSSGTVLECLERLLPQAPTAALESSAGSGSISISSVRLYLGYLRDKQRRRWVVEKATELGADGIVMLHTDRSNAVAAGNKYAKKDAAAAAAKPLRDEDLDKHRRHAIEAAEQSERLTVPEVPPHAAGSVDEIADRIREASSDGASKSNDGNDSDVWLVCRERSETSPPVLSALRAIAERNNAAGGDGGETNTNDSDSDSVKPRTVHVLVGPEGGWSPRELELFSRLREETATEGGTERVRFVSLGGTVLRAETAAIAAVGAVQLYRDAL